ncbi:MAG: antitoxin [Candidatus Woesearchaeota archaeon]|nr:antitoxin [Candidatus Woesearchaeota archaeon]
MTKIISISDDAYDGLAKMKEGKDSFTKVILRLLETKRKRNILDFAGIWEGDKESEKIFTNVLAERKRYRGRAAKKW